MDPDTSSSAYQAGQQVGRMIVPIGLGIVFLLGGGWFLFSIIKAFTRKTKGWIISSVIAGVLAFACFIACVGLLVNKSVEAARITREGGGKKKLMTGKSGSCSIEIPSNWQDLPQLGSQLDSEIGVGNGSREVYALVIQESRGDYDGDLQAYDNQVIKAMRSKLSDTDVSDVEIRTINGLPGRQHRLAGTHEKLHIVYFVATIETPEHFYQVLTWTLASKEANAKASLIGVIDSFKSTAVSGTILPERGLHGSAKSSGSTEDRVRKITSDQFDLDPSVVKPESSFTKDLGADSLDTVELVMAIEEEFDLEIPDDVAGKLETVGQLVKWIDENKSH